MTIVQFREHNSSAFQRIINITRKVKHKCPGKEVPYYQPYDMISMQTTKIKKLSSISAKISEHTFTSYDPSRGKICSIEQRANMPQLRLLPFNLQNRKGIITHMRKEKQEKSYHRAWKKAEIHPLSIRTWVINFFSFIFFRLLTLNPTDYIYSIFESSKLR